jgi:hypothetical protein
MATINQADPVSFEAAQAMIESDSALREALERVNQLDFKMLGCVQHQRIGLRPGTEGQ